MLLIFTATNFRALQDTDNHVAGSDGAVHHTLRSGTDYWVYQDVADARPAGSVNCEVTIGAQHWNPTLVTGLPTAASDPTTEGSTSYRYVGRFTAPATGDATITCEALSNHWMLSRDSTGLAIWAGACCVGCFVPFIGLLIIVVVALRRRRAHERMTGYRG